ncbi:MAG: flavodoxin-dependent (E)-4-hydroxy-3-methylbut-2-enyl-diphosphate synthase, partial [Nitrospirota bacterium]|nr:flavodoxin-dependent (E)-4-hydroxy-3-methylbut-2-enyl-diphosphate synthase [Nitrospirota bacterium]MDX2420705.1 flavodoxin-dependent (E)-4-hydroxy-3-methylbut-2-enyl-diphosphate synthase [Nitrospirota bacterium]
RLAHIKNPITVSVLGCVVNGIGEGKEADIGIAGGQGVGIVFKKGKPYKCVPSEELMDILIEEVEAMAKEQDAESSGSSVSPSSPSKTPLEELLLASARPSSREIPMLPLK